MSSTFLGVGWRFPVGLANAGIATAEYEEAVRQSIWIILATARGERQMRPDFGCGVHDLVFAVNSPEAAGRVASEVREALIQWEPRIDLTRVDAGADVENVGRLLIEIEYKVRATNNRFNLVYPFFLE
jgi:phage baseplate assembly protein W